MSREDIYQRIGALSSSQRTALQKRLESAEQIPGSTQLSLIVVPREGKELTSQEVLNHLRSHLPPAMVPADVQIDREMPRLPNGKIDYKTLQQRANRFRNRRRTGAVVMPDAEGTPDNHFAETMREIWSEVLKVSPISNDDDFFELGGDSIQSILVAAKAAKRGLEFSAAELFDYSTIGELVSNRALPLTSYGREAATSTYPKDGTSLAPVFVIHTNRRFTEPFSKALGDQRTVHALANGWDAAFLPRDLSIEQMAKQQIACIKAIDANGPYCIAGYSNSCVTAYEVAQVLREEGKRVELLILIDPSVEDGQYEFDPEAREAKRISERHRLANRIQHRFREAGFFRWFFVASRKRVKLALIALISRFCKRIGIGVPARFRIRHFSRIHSQAIARYVIRDYPGDVVICLSEDRYSFNKSMVWRELIEGSIRVIGVRAGHIDLWYDRDVLSDLANQLAAILKEREAAHADGDTGSSA